MKDKLEELTEYLDRAYGIDYWSDDAIDYARALVNQLGVEQWDALSAGWNAKDIEWQVRLAEAVFGCESPRRVDLLLAMLRSEVMDVAVAAAKSLEASDDVWAPDPSMRSLLQYLHDRAKEEDKYIFEILLAKISD
jgi:hypothetical protein